MQVKKLGYIENMEQSLLFQTFLVRSIMKIFTAIIERDSDTSLYVGYVPGFSGAHSQAETLDELQSNLREVIEMLLEDENLVFETEFVGTQQIMVA
jgi:predicted RNase H-like HicB family nuclease